MQIQPRLMTCEFLLREHDLRSSSQLDERIAPAMAVWDVEFADILGVGAIPVDEIDEPPYDEFNDWLTRWRLSEVAVVRDHDDDRCIRRLRVR